MEYRLIAEAYRENRKEKLSYDCRIAYYTGCFAQTKNPNKLYEELIKSIGNENRPMYSDEIFDFLKNMSNIPIATGFNIPLDLSPEFNINTFGYVLFIKADIEIYLPDVVLSIDNVIQKPDKYTIRAKNSKVKIKYENQVYTIMVIRK